MGGGQKKEDFFARRKEKFLQKMVELGYDLFGVKDFVEEQGIYEESAEIVIDYLNNPNYVNQLKRQYLPPFNPLRAGPVSYQFEDDKSLIRTD
jgi:hypothetical protein